MKFLRQDSENQNLLNFRRSSLSILSNKSLQNYGSSRPTSFKKNHGYSNISQIHSSDMSDYVNGNIVSSSSPQSAESYSPGGCVVSSSPHSQRMAQPQHAPAPPKSLNYVTVMESHFHAGPHKLSRPLSICPPSDSDALIDAGRRFKTPSFKRSWMSPQSSPVVDYCQIDFTCTYALREVDRLLLAKMGSRASAGAATGTTGGDYSSSRDASKISGGGSPDDLDSCQSFDQADSYSISSVVAACGKDRKQKNSANKRCFRRLFSRKVTESTN